MRRYLQLAGSAAAVVFLAQGCATEYVEETDDAYSADRAACRFKRGAKSEVTAGVGAKIPAGTVEKIVVLMQENRSFDHLFHNLNNYAKRSDIDLAKEIVQPMKPDYSGEGRDQGPFVEGQHAPHLCFGDTNHEWYAAHEQFNNGKMNGFWQTNQSKTELGLAPEHTLGARALWWYDERDIPFYYDLAATFGIGDKYFSSVLGPTFPNRDFLYGATSKGLTYNFSPTPKHAKDLGDHPFQHMYDPDNPETIFDALEAKGISWKVYSAVSKFGIDLPIVAGVSSAIGSAGPFTRWGVKSITHFKDIGDYYEDAKKGELPAVSFVDANLTGGAPPSNDDHPPGNIQDGEKFVATIVNTLMTGKDWKRSALFITWDENGGLYDHVTPPKACVPDDSKVRAGYEDEDQERIEEHPEEGFDRLGFRVPVIVVSPFVKPRHVSHKTYDHSSIIRFIELKHGLNALTARDANADPMLDFFDFNKKAYMNPPKLKAPGDNKAEAKYCEDMFGPPSLSEKVKKIAGKIGSFLNPFDD